MTDREILELAAKAAGYEWRWYFSPAGQLFQVKQPESWVFWSPLQDDGDALRLAVKLNLHMRPLAFLHPPSHEIVVGVSGWDGVTEMADGDPYAATRRAFVRVAAEIGRHLNDR